MGWSKLRNAFKVAAASFVGGPSGAVAVYAKDKMKDQKEKIAEEYEAKASEQAGRLAAEKEKTKGYEEDKAAQEAMRKKLATLGRVAAGTAFSDTRTGTAKVYS